MLAALGLAHPVAQPLLQGPSLFHPQAQPLIVSEWLQQLQTSHAHIPLLKSLMRSLPSLCLFLTSKKTFQKPPSRPLMCHWSELCHIYHTVCLAFASGVAGHFWFGISWGCRHLKARLELKDLIPEWRTQKPGQVVPAVVRRPRFCRFLQRLPHGVAAGFPQHEWSRTPKQAVTPFMTQHQKPRTITSALWTL